MRDNNMENNLKWNILPSSLVANNEFDVPNFADWWEEFFDVPGSHPLRELHDENCARIPLLRRQLKFRKCGHELCGYLIIFKQLLTFLQLSIDDVLTCGSAGLSGDFDLDLPNPLPNRPPPPNLGGERRPRPKPRGLFDRLLSRLLERRLRSLH